MDLATQLRSDPGLLAYGSSVTITAEPDLIRIDLTDMATRPLFETGDGALNETGIALTRTTGIVLAHLPYQLRIEGHTDSNPSLTEGYSNWELSADRANSARRILEVLAWPQSGSARSVDWPIHGHFYPQLPRFLPIDASRLFWSSASRARRKGPR